MEKRKSEKKSSLKWILIAAAVVLLAAAVGIILWLTGSDKKDAQAQSQNQAASAAENKVKLYWNVERTEYVAGNTDGTSSRYPRGDGYFYIRFAVDGEQVDYPIADYALVNRIDHMEICHLVFDENGVVVDALGVNECTGGLVAPALYVQSVEGNKVVGNTQGTYLGVNVTIELTEQTEIYSVGGTGILSGVPCQIQPDDEIIAVKNLDGSIGYVYVIAYEPPGDVYWNIYRKYNSTTKMTTRESDPMGYYFFDFALNGEVVTLRTRDQKVANSIDSRGAKCMGLTLDENGEITAALATASVQCPTTFGSWYHVTAFTDTTVTAERIAAGTDQGNVVTGTLSPDCKIVDVSAVGGYSGAYTQLRVGDQIHGLKDSRGRIAYIFVHTRLGGDEMPLYWNCARKYNSTTGTTRTPDADGWYYAQVATGGQQITVKTQDKSKMDTLDSYGARCFTMSLTGDNEIDRIGSASAAHGGGTFGSWYYVDAIEGNQITVSRILTGDSTPTVVTGTMSADIEIINGSTNYTSHCGEYTELQVGDRVHGLTDMKKEVRVLFVVDRPANVPLYWNLTRGYNSTTKETTKKPDADGFYWFTMAVDGKQVQLKTRSKEIANKIDSNAACCTGLHVWNGEITKVVSASSVKGYTGGTMSISWVDVISVEGQYVVCQKNQAGHAQDGKRFNVYLGNACEIYDVSTGYTDYAGEPTTLRVGDRIHALHNGEGICMIAWVVGGRAKPLNTKPADCACAQGANWEPWDGTTELEDGKYYYLTSDVVAPTEGFYLENMAVHLRLDGHTISSDGRCFYTVAGAKLNICDHGTRGKLIGTGVSNESGGVIRMYSGSNDAVINLWNVDVICNADSTPGKEGGAISCAGPMSLYNVHVIGGVASNKGGNVTVSKYGTFRMFGGSLKDGVAKGGPGGNLNVEGVIYLEDVTVSGGTASAAGDNIFFAGASYEKRINGLTTTDGDVTLSVGRIGVLGTVKTDLTMLAGTSMENMGLNTDSKFNLTMKTEGTVLSKADTDLTGLFVNTDDTGDYVLSYDSKDKKVVMECTIVPKTHSADHCVCAGADTGLAAHTCATLTGWTEITDDVFEPATGTSGIQFKQSGNYYLSVPYTLTGSLNILPDQEITICLNGCRLTGSGQIGRVAGVLNVTDCVGGGKVYSTTNSTNGNTYKVMAGGELNIFAGTHTSEAACNDGGVVVVSQDKGGIAPSDCTEPGVFNLYGGTVTGGTANYGGNILLWHTSVFNMYGGTISDGHATQGANLNLRNENATANLLGGTISNGDVKNSGGKLYLGGDIKIEKLDGNGKLVAISDKGLGSSASITMVAGSIGTLVSNVEASEYARFSFIDIGTNLTVNYDAAQKAIVTTFNYSHKHCACGGVKPAGHTCTEEGWLPLSAETVEDYFSVSSSRYVSKSQELYLYLEEDLDLKYSINLNDGQTIHLCLNGFDLTHTKTTNPVMRVWGDLDITDCSSGAKGSIIGHRTGESPCLYVQNWLTGTTWCSPTVNLYAGTLTADDNDSSQKAGVMQVGNKVSPNNDQIAVFNMYGGKITGGSAKNGGNLYLESTDVLFNMYGGTITGGFASSSGGGIYVSSAGARVNLLGGTVTGNTANAYGDDMYTVSTVDMTLGGTVKIGEFYSNLLVLKLKNLNANSSITLLRNAPGTGVFATGADTDVSKCFTNPKLTAVWDKDAKTLSFADNTTSPETTHMHCLCADAAGMGSSHSCKDTGFVELKQADFDSATATSSPVYLRTEGSTTYYAFADGSYYLSENVTIKKPICLDPSASVSLCLNGQTLTGSGCRTIYTKGVLNITDCAYTTNSDGTHTYKGTITVTNFGAHAPVLYARTESTISIYGGNLVGTKLDSTATTGGGTVCVGGILNIYDGKISGGDVSAIKKNGGNMAIMDSATVNMYGGIITGGKVATTQSGGNIRVDTGTFNMYGGTVSDGTANEGGNIAIGANGIFNLYDGKVQDGNAGANGGNFAAFGKLNISGGAISGGKAGSNGGNITTYANKSAVTMTGGVVENGTCPTGANIAMRTSGSTKVTLTVTGGQIKGGDGKSVHIANFAAITVTVGGDAKIDCIYLGGADRRVTISSTKPLTAAASIAIAAAGEQTVVNGTVTTGLKAYDSNYDLVVEDGVIKLKAK